MEPIRVEADGSRAVIIGWKFADGTVHEFMYTCPSSLELEARDDLKCPNCHTTKIVVQAFCGHCGMAFVR